MKFLAGTITGIVLAVGGVAYASNAHQTTAAADLSQVQYAPQVIPQSQTAVTRVQQLRRRARAQGQRDVRAEDR